MTVSIADVEAFLLPFRAAGQAAVSPDATTVAYTVTGTDPTSMTSTSALWTVAIDGTDARHRHSGPVTRPHWTPDGSAIVFAAGATLHRLDPATGSLSDIATHDTDIADLALSPDGATIAFVARVDPDTGRSLPGGLRPVRVITRQDYKQDGVGMPNESFLQVFLADTVAGEIRRLSTAATDHVGLRWSSDGARVAVFSSLRHVFANDVTVFDVAQDTNCVIGDGNSAITSFDWLPGTHSLLAWRRTRSLVGSGVVTVDTDAGAIESIPNPREVAAAFTASAIAVLDARTAIMAGLETGRSGLWRIDPGTRAMARISLTDDLRSGIAAAGSDAIVQEWSGPDGDSELIAVNATTGECTFLTDLNRGHIAAHRVGTIDQRSVRHGDLDIPYLIKFPHDFDPTKRYPVVFEIHGGPHYLRGYAIEPSNQFLLDAGYLVVCPNPRGSVSWGAAYTGGVQGDWGGGDWNDDLAVVDAVGALPYVDESRIGIYGYSYGGYMTSWAIGQTDRFRAAVIGAPLTDLISRDGTVDIATGSPLWEFRGEMPALREFLIERSPVTWAHRATTPTLILHPEDDQRCAIGQSEELFHILKRAGVETEFIRYPGQFHLMPWDGPMPYRIDFHHRVVDWFQRHL